MRIMFFTTYAHTSTQKGDEITAYHKAKCLLERVIMISLNLDGLSVPSLISSTKETKMVLRYLSGQLRHKAEEWVSLFHSAHL